MGKVPRACDVRKERPQVVKQRHLRPYLWSPLLAKLTLEAFGAPSFISRGGAHDHSPHDGCDHDRRARARGHDYGHGPPESYGPGRW